MTSNFCRGPDLSSPKSRSITKQNGRSQVGFGIPGGCLHERESGSPIWIDDDLISDVVSQHVVVLRESIDGPNI